MKLVLFLSTFLALSLPVAAQQTDSLPAKKIVRKPVAVKHTSVLPVKKDSLVQVSKKMEDSVVTKSDSTRLIAAQQADSLSRIKDSLQLLAAHRADSLVRRKDSLHNAVLLYKSNFQNFLKENKYLHYAGTPKAMIDAEKKAVPVDTMFYAFLVVLALLAFLRFFYLRYFNNLFQVFFNTSLRQGQLTDQLLQAKLPSLFFNIISMVSGGLFIYFLLRYFDKIPVSRPLTILAICVAGTATIYFMKFLVLKFIGWVTGYKEVTNTYIFIIFLINKILGILLLPFILVMAFSAPFLIKASVLIAILLSAVMFLMRFYRSYGLLQHQLNFNRLHFCMYIAGIEVLPVLLIYKGLVLLLSKNL